ncbi:MAG: DUF4430 domain-containing protein [Sedimentibacter sp.]|uniref:DUF4430 domain-containing protein n=1 Tax=Sedimentibacter sp. TaxID=1960295 RepID=UPI00315832F2
MKNRKIWIVLLLFFLGVCTALALQLAAEGLDSNTPTAKDEEAAVAHSEQPETQTGKQDVLPEDKELNDDNETPAAENVLAKPSKDADPSDDVDGKNDDGAKAENETVNQPSEAEASKADESDAAKELKCTLSVDCKTILDNMDRLNPEKEDILPEDGIIYGAREVVFYQGETVFDVLLREMKNNRIHMEYSMNPLYNSDYIEGIGNFYELDCGELSGWVYLVNGKSPNYGSSQYKLSENDVIQWRYTCDLGRDVGAAFDGKDGSKQ